MSSVSLLSTSKKEISISSGVKLKESKSGDVSASVTKESKVHNHVMTTGTGDIKKRLSALERKLHFCTEPGSLAGTHPRLELPKYGTARFVYSWYNALKSNNSV